MFALTLITTIQAEKDLAVLKGLTLSYSSEGSPALAVLRQS